MPNSMTALTLEDGILAIQERPVPQPAPGEALIRVLMAGICNTDLELSRGYMNFNGILGHEFVGVVEAAPSSHWVGRRVVGEINCVCHDCRYCRLEMPQHCEKRSVLGILNRDGAFTKYLCLPEENLHQVPNGVSDDVAVFCEPVAAAFRIPEQITINPDDRIIVLGDGKLAQLIAQVLSLHSKKVTCVGKHTWKLRLLQNLRIDTAILDDMPNPNADIVVDATGTAAGFNTAMRMVRPEGTLVLKSTVADSSNYDMSLPVINEVRIIGSRCGPFRPALEALAMGNIEVRPMITAHYPLNEALTAMQRAAEPDVMKVLIEMD